MMIRGLKINLMKKVERTLYVQFKYEEITESYDDRLQISEGLPLRDVCLYDKTSSSGLKLPKIKFCYLLARPF